MLEITPDDIAVLKDDDLRSLVGYLCESELRSRGLSPSSVTWGGDQNAADGGIDVRVTLPGNQPVGGFLPRPHIGFQVKKTDFTPGLISPEMRPRGELRPSILSLIAERGAYIIVSSGSHTSDSALNDRLAAMRNAVGNADPTKALQLDFYDRSRLATWARSHPGLMVWVRKRIGRAIAGWRPYESWAYSPEGVKDEYLADDKARLHAGTRDEKGLSVSNGIQRIREALGKPRGVVRLAGLSGVGKTRLVQALFDERVGNSSLDPAIVVYTDMSDNPDPQPTGMVHDLIAARMRAIVAVDNCAPDLHRRLTEICHTAESTVSVITVEYDIQDDEPEGTEVFRLEPSTPGLVAELIMRRFPEMSRIDINTISEFSGGNARVALALANTLERNETLAGLKDEELFRRLFHQRQAHDNSLQSAAQACALVYSFQGEALSGPAAELPIISSLVGMTAQELFAKVAELKQRDLVQRRGEWRAILPHAVANRLAVMALKAIPLEIIEGQFTTERLLRSFSRRLGYLHESQEATRVVEKWLGQHGLLENVATLTELGLAMFDNIAPVSPPATLNSIERALIGPNAQGVTEEVWRREQIGSVLRSLAYDADLFDRAISALLTLADAEPQDRHSHTIEDLIVGMFHIYLSGTHATADQRSSVVEALLRSPDTRGQALGTRLLDAMLQTSHFSGHSFEFGARPRDYGYWPTKHSEIEKWYLTILHVAAPLAFSDLTIAKTVRSELAGAFRGLWFVSTAIQDQLEHISHTLFAKEYWQEGWIAVRTMLSFPNDNADEKSMVRLRVLEKVLRPKNLAEQVRTVVLTQTWGRLDYADMDNGDETANEGPTISSHERANAAAEELGKEVVKNVGLLTTLVSDIVRGNGGRLILFGKGLALGTSNRKDVWDKLTKALAETPEGERNAGALCGFLLGMQIDDPALCERFLDEALEHETLAAWFPVLQTTVPVTRDGVARLKRAVALGKAPIAGFQSLGWGRSSDAISGADLKELLFAIAARSQGYATATDILSMRLHFDKDNKTAHSPELLEAGRALLSQAQFDDRDNMHDYRLRVIVDACLPSKAGEEAARSVCTRFKKGLADHSVYAFNFDQLVEGLFKTQPRIALDVFFRTDTEDGAESIEVDLFDDPTDHRKNPLDAVTADEILSWCAEGGQPRYVAIAKAVSFFDTAKDSPLVWSPIALKLLDIAPDPLAVLNVFIERFSPRSWSGSRAAIMESRARLLDQLDNYPNPAIAALASQARPKLQAEIAQTREWETKRDRERDERFE